MELNKLLIRQLQRSGLPDLFSSDISNEWKRFISLINDTYNDSDEERYFLERSIEISSRELLQLNKKLENTQHIAKLGYWTYSPVEDKVTFSDEVRYFLGLKNKYFSCTISDFKHYFMKNDYKKFDAMLENVLSKHKNYEIDLRIAKSKKMHRWYRLFAKPYTDNNLMMDGVIIDITSHKEDQEKIISLSHKLLETARYAGMADMASSVLHNIGNVITSSSVSLEYLKENLHELHYEKLFLIIKMLKDNKSSLEEYLTRDEKGKLIPLYLINMGDSFEKAYKEIYMEIDNLFEQIQHVVKILAFQQEIASSSLMRETLFLPEILDTAIQMNSASFAKHNIEIVKDYQCEPFLYTDKLKLFQIFNNVFKNSKEAILNMENQDDKKITITLKESKITKYVEILIKDNGCGISADDIKKIFTLGFTTKNNSSGLGLHTSALMAKELGGSLHMTSEGVGKGAECIFTLPLGDNGKEEKNAK